MPVTSVLYGVNLALTTAVVLLMTHEARWQF
ncbi:hypothetical protein PANA5342_pPANA10074 (plasmid) [Pantoea ananatis LMG 5342]|nr:hypothetical protein PANA5342_pPANA10074 [Pantoea ananatis LMG 5342]